MSEIQEQLAVLRKRIARIDRKYESGALRPPRDAPKPSPKLDLLGGREVETPFGKHLEMEKLYECHKRHGSADISSLAELPHDLLNRISNGEIANSSPAEWAFLDTETTGLAGGSGTYAFLVGIGRITPEGFRIRQFFMRDYGEEASHLWAMAEYLAQFSVLVTYNGKAYDQPLLETRYRMTRSRPPFARMRHLDLLFGARRLWKLRFDSCRLIDLENQILGVERTGDLPGEMIPYVYFEYLRTAEAFRMVPIFHHNAIDILTLACLTGIVPWAFRSPEESNLAHGAEMVGLGRWLRNADQPDRAADLFRRAIERGLKDELLFRTLWDLALLEKKLGRESACLAGLAELVQCRNPFRVAAYEELAKHYEHRERNYAMALEMTRTALVLEDCERLRRRETRLGVRLAKPASRRLL